MTRLLSIFCCITAIIFSCSEQSDNYIEGYLSTPDSTQIFYQKFGNGPDAIIIPGGMYLSQEFKYLASKNRTLVFYDQRSRGKSKMINDKSQLGISYELSDLESIRRYFGFDRVSLIGWSYSGAVVALYATENPDVVKRIVQIGPIPARKIPYFDQYVLTMNSRRDSNEVAYLNDLKHQFEATGNLEEYIRNYYAVAHKALKYDQTAKEQFRFDFFELENERPDRSFDVVLPTIITSFGDWDFREEIQKISIPALTIHGDYDAIPLESAQEWASSLPNGRLMVISNAGHLPWFEKPEIFFPAVDIFLNGEWPEIAPNF